MATTTCLLVAHRAVLCNAMLVRGDDSPSHQSHKRLVAHSCLHSKVLLTLSCKVYGDTFTHNGWRASVIVFNVSPLLFATTGDCCSDHAAILQNENLPCCGSMSVASGSFQAVLKQFNLCFRITRTLWEWNSFNEDQGPLPSRSTGSPAQ